MPPPGWWQQRGLFPSAHRMSSHITSILSKISSNAKTVPARSTLGRLVGDRSIDVPLEHILQGVDGLSVGDVGNIVLRDRKHLSQDGLIVVVVSISAQTHQIIAGPDVISRGFVYMRESEELMEETRRIAKETLDMLLMRNVTDWATLKSEIRSELGIYFNKETKRTPMILPVIMEV